MFDFLGNLSIKMLICSVIYKKIQLKCIVGHLQTI